MNEIENDMASTEKSNNNRKGGRNRTGVWKYYTEVNNRAKCEFCDYDCIKNAKRMAKHTISCKFAPKDASEICSQYFAGKHLLVYFSKLRTHCYFYVNNLKIICSASRILALWDSLNFLTQI